MLPLFAQLISRKNLTVTRNSFQNGRETLPISFSHDFLELITFVCYVRFHLSQEIVPRVALNTRALIKLFSFV